MRGGDRRVNADVDLRTYLGNRRDIRASDIDRIMQVALDLHNDARARRGLPPVDQDAGEDQEPRFLEEAIWHVQHESVGSGDRTPLPMLSRERALDAQADAALERAIVRQRTASATTVVLGVGGAVATVVVGGLLLAAGIQSSRVDLLEAIASRDAGRFERDALIHRAAKLGESVADEGADLKSLLDANARATAQERAVQAAALLAALPGAIDTLRPDDSRQTARRFLRAEASSTGVALTQAVADLQSRQHEVDQLYYRPFAGPLLWLGTVDDPPDYQIPSHSVRQ